MKHSTPKKIPTQPAPANSRRLRRAALARARRGLTGPVELTPDPRAAAQGAGGLFVPSLYAVAEGDDL